MPTSRDAPCSTTSPPWTTSWSPACRRSWSRRSPWCSARSTHPGRGRARSTTSRPRSPHRRCAATISNLGQALLAPGRESVAERIRQQAMHLCAERLCVDLGARYPELLGAARRAPGDDRDERRQRAGHHLARGDLRVPRRREPAPLGRAARPLLHRAPPRLRPPPPPREARDVARWLYALGAAAARRPRSVLTTWMVLLALSAGALPRLGAALSPQVTLPGTRDGAGHRPARARSSPTPAAAAAASCSPARTARS